MQVANLRYSRLQIGATGSRPHSGPSHSLISNGSAIRFKFLKSNIVELITR
jgi:hypothetical protein